MYSPYRGYAVAHLVKALCYKPQGRGVRFPMVPFEFFSLALGLAQPLT
jgi:hypothetical protein